MTIMLILVFIINGVLTVEAKPFKTLEACIEAGNQRIQEQMLNPHFDRGLFADCVETRSTEIKQIGARLIWQ